MLKKANFLSLLIFLFILPTQIFAQNAENPWAVSVGADLIYFNNSENNEDVYSFGAPALSLSYYLGAGFSISTQYVSNDIGNSETDTEITSFDNIIKYNLSDNDLIPYLFAGYGFTKFNEEAEGNFSQLEKTTSTPLVGLGLNYYLNENLSINASLSFRKDKERNSYNHLQHIIGLSYNFGMEDSDKDGVSDKKDNCPNTPGLKEFSGCPDTDGDGIPDNKDKCPNKAGNETNGGCPDTDGDGIIDNDDACPNAAGSFDMNGCPDSDADTVPDNLDPCPKQAGDPLNQGCPWADRDNDGVADKDDNCPDVAGKASNNGCPDQPMGLIQYIESSKSTIGFTLESFELTPSAALSLKELAILMDQYPKEKIIIEGHASSDGEATYNHYLSLQRAAAVKDYLMIEGIQADRLSTLGLGANNPIKENTTAAGRAANRRAKINRKQ